MSKIMTVIDGFYKPGKIQLDCQIIMCNIDNITTASIPPKLVVESDKYCRGGV